MSDSIITKQEIDEKTLVEAKYFRAHQTPQEKLLWEHLRAGRLAGLHFRRQQVIGQFIVDFYHHGAKVVIEVDGCVHDAPDQLEYDCLRTSILEENGLRVIRFRNEEIERDLDLVLEKIQFECQPKINERVII
jgi:very-short-patch-repair endonuclease